MRTGPYTAVRRVELAQVSQAEDAERASDPVLVHWLAHLLHASFRARLATTPLHFAITSPLSGCEKDLHLQAVEHARHTEKGRGTHPRRISKSWNYSDLLSPSPGAGPPLASRFACCSCMAFSTSSRRLARSSARFSRRSSRIFSEPISSMNAFSPPSPLRKPVRTIRR